MPNRIVLNISCPDCGHSMMDPDHLIEGVPSVLCNIEVPGPNPKYPLKKPIRFCSYYGSSHFECEVRLEDNKRMVLSCPRCETNLHGEFTCTSCGEPMVTLNFKEGGKLVACTKRGCKKHFLQLDENVPGLERLFHMATRQQDGSVPSPLHAREIKAEYTSEKHKEIISSGSFLATYCPHCQESIVEDDCMVFRVQTQAGAVGLFYLSAYLNVYSNKHTVEIPHSEEVADLRCIHCDHTLMYSDIGCGKCDSHTARVTVSAMRKLISFHICMKTGCHWHDISEKDNQLIRLEDSLEW
jgi:ssDNA-binding Zn-finger/Zn-ribbon topoisomerase 1